MGCLLLTFQDVLYILRIEGEDLSRYAKYREGAIQREKVGKVRHL